MDIASSREQTEIKRYLEYHGVNAEFVSGRNANELFRTAVDQWNVPVMKFLVSKGADVNANAGTLMGIPQTPLNVARTTAYSGATKKKTFEADSKAIIRILERAGAK